ncbi:MAG: hypothetical protein FJ096_19120 [Deltaproteobacteria bacterium]|nr:hypothetical protein [Deltaproteobacteria bacterium]
MVTRAAVLLLATRLVACTGPEAPPTTGGVDVVAGAFGRGLALVMSDYQSTNVALIDCNGNTLSGSFLSSGAALPGVSAPLSGDVVLPGELQEGTELALIDRYPAAVITLVDVRTGDVTRQLDVGTGFRANPQDLVTIDGDLWISRYETNAEPGKLPFDAGGDLIVVNRTSRELEARIDLSAAMSDAPGFWPRPGRLVRDGGRVQALLAAYDPSFQNAADSRLVEIDIASREVVRTHRLEGLAGCGALAIEPAFEEDGSSRPSRRVVVGCSGRFQGTSAPALEASGVVLLEPTEEGLGEVRRWSASELTSRPVGFDMTFDAGGKVLVTAMGRLADGVVGDRPDALVEIDLASGTTRVVLETTSRPFELGGVRCATRVGADAGGDGAACRGDCFVADGEAGVLWRLVRGAVGYVALETIEVEDAIGLPPRWLGRF